ncbi:hypothetical protein QLS71_013995 [Mariniflexile litorale]|uniref:GLPGLI family protein n=1 Tax=Mariniflexile litorale TaxID=3045158 RepID=A0AAU7ECX8_9FLAO|nr:hypothetical protein [Mariniflexile sp. KMM 9835]MDQ8213606.1 hypothetical protein [Mariniflexile sp. KMM 9835]
MKRILTVLIILISTNIFGQKNMLETLTIDSTTKIIGRYPQYDKTRTYEKYNFIIEDSVEISNFIRNIKLGDEVPNSSESPSFRITIVKNFKEEGTWTINPTQKSVMTHDGHTYKFDIDQITELNEKFSFKYNHKKIIFKSPEEYQAYLIEQKKNPNFLFDYKPQFKYEGSFEIEFEKSNKFSSPKAISEFLYPYIDKIVDRNEYRVSYILNKKNMKNNGKSYTMTITGPKKIYENLEIKKLKNENWESTVEDGWFFYRE